MSQLDLFTHVQPMAQIFHFPSDRGVSFAHSIAQRLDVLEFEAGKELWKGVCADFRRELRSGGSSPAEIKASIDRLADDVHQTLRHLSILKQYRAPAVILSLREYSASFHQHGEGDGAAGVRGQGTKSLAGLGGAHNLKEYDAARAHDGGAA